MGYSINIQYGERIAELEKDVEKNRANSDELIKRLNATNAEVSAGLQLSFEKPRRTLISKLLFFFFCSVALSIKVCMFAITLWEFPLKFLLFL